MLLEDTYILPFHKEDTIGENGGAPPFGEHRPPKYNEK